MAATGLGLCGYAGLQWRELPVYSEGDIRISTELNLAADIGRRSADSQPDQTEMDALRQQVRSEMEADITAEHQAVLSWLISGIALMAFAGISVLMSRSR